MNQETKAELSLAELTRREVDLYAGFSFTTKAYTIFDDEQRIYAAVSVPHLPRPWPSRVIVMAQVVGDKVVIIEDITDKPLVNALMHNAGIPATKSSWPTRASRCRKRRGEAQEA